MNGDDTNENIEGLDSDMTNDIILVSCENTDPVRMPVDREVASQSNLVKQALVSDKNAEEMVLGHVARDLLPLIVDYMKHHHNNPAGEVAQPLKGPNLTESGVSEWDTKFMELPGVAPPTAEESKDAPDNVAIRNSPALRLLDASNYMDIGPLTQLCGAKLGSLIINEHVNVRLHAVGLPPQPEDEFGDASEDDDEDDDEDETMTDAVVEADA
jgi:hypothetical protein